MRVNVLGTVEVVVDDVPVSIAGAKERTVLALLLASAGRPVSNDRMTDELWPDRPPESACASIQVFVSRLRRQLGAGGDLLRRTPAGYVLQVTPETLDAGRFTDLAASGRRLLADGDPAAAALLLREATDLWRGPAYLGIAAPTVRAAADQLDEQRIAAQEALFDADLAIGRHDAILAEVDREIAARPLHERFWAQRMTALYRCGRQAEALATYQALRALTREELGTDPTPELRDLELAVLRQDDALAWHPARGALVHLAHSYRDASYLMAARALDAAERGDLATARTLFDGFLARIASSLGTTAEAALLGRETQIA